MIFKSVDQALRFAFEVIDSNIVKMAKLEMNEIHSTAPSGLSPQENHGEAALILGAAARILPGDCQLYILSRYSADMDAQLHAIRSLASGYVVPSLAIKNSGMAIELSSRYFNRERLGGRKSKLRGASSNTIGNNYSTPKSTSQYWEGKIAAYIATIAARSDTLLGDYLIEKGVILPNC